MQTSTIILMTAGAIGGIVILIALFGSFFTVEQNHLGLVERFGKLNRVSKSGLGLKLPVVEQIREISLKLQQLVVEIQSITSDKVSVDVKVTIQHEVMEERAADAAYKLENPNEQITALVFDTVRSELPRLTLDQAFDSKDQIEKAVKAKLASIMEGYGYRIIAALVTDIAPDAKVVASMNEINASRRLREAAQEKGEAEKILAVKLAEAKAETMRLEGEGIAKQRQAIVAGMKSAMAEMKSVMGDGVDAGEILSSIFLPQYMEMLEKVGGDGKVIFLNHGPGAVADLQTQLMSAMHSKSSKAEKA